jgi:hypothetical protein
LSRLRSSIFNSALGKSNKFALLSLNEIVQFDVRIGTVSSLEETQISAMEYANETLWYAKNNAIYIYKEGEHHLFLEIEG